MGLHNAKAVGSSTASSVTCIASITSASKSSARRAFGARRVAADPRLEASRRSDEARLPVAPRAAEQVLVRTGYANCSTNAIARHAGVWVGSLSQYFEDKETVFRAVVRRYQNAVKLIIVAAERMAAAQTDPVAVTLDLTREMERTNARNPTLMTAIEQELGWLEHTGMQPSFEHASAEFLAKARAASSRNGGRERAQVLDRVHAVKLVHGKPAGRDTELFMDAAGHMLRALTIGPLLQRCGAKWGTSYPLGK